MKFKYNAYEKPSSKSYMAPQIMEIEIGDIKKTTDENGSTVFDVYTEKGGIKKLGEVGLEQLKLFLINTYARRKKYSEVILNIHEEDAE